MAQTPESIDKYKIEALIASGGMGAVYKGIHPTLNRPVILKKLTLRGSPAFAERFRREARILMDFRNENIVDVYDHFKSATSHYIVMEYVDGVSVEQLIERERYLDDATAAWITLQTARALRYAHGKKVVHRDIKPANILISRTGEIKLADFGIATSREDEDQGLTGAGMTLGTPAYMAPEQIDDSHSVDQRSDIYSLGVTLYEMLTGKKPHPGSFSAKLVLAIKKGRYPSPRKFHPGLSGYLVKLIHRLMRPRLKDRCKDLSEIIPSLERFVAHWDEKALAARLSALVSEQASKPPQPRRMAWWQRNLLLGSLAALPILAGGLYLGLTGVWQPLVMGERYGWVQLSLDAATWPEALAEGGPSTALYLDDGSGIPRLDQAPLFLPWPLATPDRRDSLVFALPAGQYRAKTSIGTQVYWTGFHVEPAASEPATQAVTVKLHAPQAIPIDVRAQANDALSGRWLGEDTVVEIRQQGEYRPLAEAGDILSGRVQRFRIGREGYYSQEFELALGSLQTRLELQAALVPLPAQLSFRLPDDKTSFRLNGLDSWPTISKGRIVGAQFQPQTSQSLSLPPGAWKLEFRREGQSSEISLDLASDTVTQLELSLQNGKPVAKLKNREETPQ